MPHLNRVQLISPDVNPPSPALQAVLDTHLPQFQAGMAYCVALGFDGEGQQQQIGFRPDLPSVMSW